MSHRRLWIAFFLFTLSLINYLDRSILSFAAKPVTAAFNLSKVELGYLFSSFLWSYTACLIPVGLLVDRYGAKTVAAIGIAVWSGGTALTGGAFSFLGLLVSRLIMGAGESTTNPAAARVIREWAPAAERGLFAALSNTGAYAGPAVSAILAGVCIEAIGWRLVFVAAAMLGFVWLLVWWLVYDKPERVGWIGAAERTQILAQRNAVPVNRAPDFDALGFRVLLQSPPLWGIAVAQGCNVYSQYLLLTWLPGYLEATRHMTILKTAFFTAIPYFLAIILTILLGFFSDRLLFGKKLVKGQRRFFISFTLLLGSLLFFTPFIESSWVLIGVFTLALTGIASTTALNFALVNDLMLSTGDIGKAIGFVVVGGNLFGILAPIVTGYIIDATGSYDGAFLIAGALLVIGSVTIILTAGRPITVPPAR